MNLKLVVASMSILGLVSCPVLAANGAKHKHHHHHAKAMKHHVHQVEARPDYKDMGSLPVEACGLSQSGMVLDQMTQSIGRAMPNPCGKDWFKRVQLSGGMNLDLGKWGSRNAGRRATGYMGENYQRLSLNDVYVNVAAEINEWTKAFASVSFSNPTQVMGGTANTGEYSSAYSNNVQNAATTSPIQIEQAYVTFANFNTSPVFIQAGKQFQDFGRYEIHPITRSMTQVMSETLATSAKLGFVVPMGLHGAVFVFDDPIARITRTAKTTNVGASLGYDQVYDSIGFDLGAAYLYNLVGVNDIANAIGQFTGNLGYTSCFWFSSLC